jgi:hypothetical protein
VIAGFAVLVGILGLELRSGKNRNRTSAWRRAMCVVSDYAPGALLLASGGFLVCFLPFQRALADFRASAFLPVDERRITDALWSLNAVPEYMLGDDAAVAFWSIVTITLSVLAISIMLWSWHRTRRTATNPA